MLTGVARPASAPASPSRTTSLHELGTPGFIDPLLMNATQASEITDGYAFAITALVTLVARPAVGLESCCRHLLRHPDRPERWQAPGLPDARASEWPAGVICRLAELVSGYGEIALYLVSRRVLHMTAGTFLQAHREVSGGPQAARRGARDARGSRRRAARAPPRCPDSPAAAGHGASGTGGQGGQPLFRARRSRARRAGRAQRAAGPGRRGAARPHPGARRSGRRAGRAGPARALLARGR